VRHYDLIAVEDLNLRGLSRGMLARSVHDAAWSLFIAILRGKAQSAGRVVIEVNPNGTSQVCSGCGFVPEERKPLSVRTHRCSECGLVRDRDTNAARNILHLAVSQKRGRADTSASWPGSRQAA
jgi:putative transposase